MTTSLSVLDTIVVFIYLAAMIAVGVIFTKKASTNEGFALMDRSMSLGVMIGTTFASAAGAFVCTGMVGQAGSMGLTAITVNITWCIGWAALIFMARDLRASGASSQPDFMRIKFGVSTKAIVGIVMVIYLMYNCAAQFKALGTIANSLGLWEISTGTIILGIATILFTVFGGLYGVAITDTIQAIMLAVGVVIILPIVVITRSGGLHNIMLMQPEGYTSFTNMTFMSFMGWCIAYMFNAGCHPAYVQRILASKDEKTAVLGSLLSNLAYAIAIIPIMICGMCSSILFPGASAEAMIPNSIAAFFPPVATGLVLSALLGLVLSTADTFLLLLGTTISGDIYPVLFKKIYNPKNEKPISRWCIVIFGILSIIIALNYPTVIALGKQAASVMGAAIFIPMVLGCKWSGKAKTWAVNAGIIAGCAVTLLWNAFLKDSTGIDGVIMGGLCCLILSVGGSLIKKDPSKLSA